MFKFFCFHRMCCSFLLYQISFFGIAAALFWYQYTQARSQTFITLQRDSGVCLGETGSSYCCEVPQIITGEFLADSKGKGYYDTTYINEPTLILLHRLLHIL